MRPYRFSTTRRGNLTAPAPTAGRPPRGGRESARGDTLDVPYWLSHSGRIRRASAILRPPRRHRTRGPHIPPA